VRAAAQATPRQCGYERWRVKILADRDGGRVDFNPVETTVAELAAIPIHEIPYPNDRRIAPEEFRTYQVRARLLRVFRESDHDLHLIIADLEQPEVHMIAEIPAPECVAERRDEYQEARSIVRETPRNTVIELVGVAFFDYIHDQRGHAPNGIELHPVLEVHPTGQ
jgi:hypothetical protein